MEAQRHVAHVLGQPHRTVVAEVVARLPGLGIDGDDAHVGHRRDDPLRARGGHAFRRLVVRHAAAGKVDVAVHVGLVRLGVVLPLDLAGLGVQRHHPAVRSAHVQGVVHLDRGDFEIELVALVRAQRDVFAELLGVAGAGGPGQLQIGHVGWGDLVERAVTVAVGGTAVVVPVACGHRGIGHAAARLGHVVAALHAVRAECGDQRHRQRQHHAAEHREGGQAAAGRAEVAAHPRRQQPQAEQERHELPRLQRPEVEAHFQQGPDHGAQQHQCIQPQRGLAAQDGQHAGQQEGDADDEVITAAAQRGQLGAAPDEAGTGNQEDQAGQDRPERFGDGW